MCSICKSVPKKVLKEVLDAGIKFHDKPKKGAKKHPNLRHKGVNSVRRDRS